MEIPRLLLVLMLAGAFVSGAVTMALAGPNTPVGVYRRLASKCRAALQPFAALKMFRQLPDHVVITLATERFGIERKARITAGDIRTAHRLHEELGRILECSTPSTPV